MGVRPSVVVRHKCQLHHPMGGGEGRRAGGRHPCSPRGVLSKGGKTRREKIQQTLKSLDVGSKLCQDR